ncbi:hypothetical protein OSB04_023536 [Centaurea solstitialis]|uniref:Reverse transcriptase Ty1/copia-type domain-containing protein n=1 Tax=Centaurea solstitialis TaxID=347529 RepID=A0AA38WB65_9ASTR|nr:hypothetical protein OSB04_023536 [Centaurea solstitialis]
MEKKKEAVGWVVLHKGYQVTIDYAFDQSELLHSGRLVRVSLEKELNKEDITKGKSRLLTSISFMLGIANLQMHQMDVKIDLLNEDLEEIYMEQPKGFVAQGKENKVCKLVNTLYGLKQAPKQ